jgi:hypothetical protein
MKNVAERPLPANSRKFHLLLLALRGSRRLEDCDVWCKVAVMAVQPPSKSAFVMSSFPVCAASPFHPTPLYSILWGFPRFVEEAYRAEPQTPIVGGLRLINGSLSPRCWAALYSPPWGRLGRPLIRIPQLKFGSRHLHLACLQDSLSAWIFPCESAICAPCLMTPGRKKAAALKNKTAP